MKSLDGVPSMPAISLDFLFPSNAGISQRLAEFLSIKIYVRRDIIESNMI